MAGVVVAIAGGGTVSTVETTTLLTVEETLEALGITQTIRYRPSAEYAASVADPGIRRPVLPHGRIQYHQEVAQFWVRDRPLASMARE